MKVSKKQFDIIMAAKPLFYKYGIRKVTVEDVCKEAQVSKMTFYKYFPNKIELLKAMLTYLFSKGIEDFKSLMDADIPFSEKLKGILELKMESAQDISRDFLVTLYGSDDQSISEFVTTYIQNALEEVMDVFRDAQEKGVMRKDINPLLLMAFYDKAQDIATDNRILALYPDGKDLVYEINKFFLYGLSEPHT